MWDYQFHIYVKKEFGLQAKKKNYCQHRIIIVKIRNNVLHYVCFATIFEHHDCCHQRGKDFKSTALRYVQCTYYFLGIVEKSSQITRKLKCDVQSHKKLF